MKNTNRSLFILFKNEFMSEQAIEHEVENLQFILSCVDSDDQFCLANELVDRNKITDDPRKILKEALQIRLKPFRFIVNKN